MGGPSLDMSKPFHGLSTVNIELSSKCNKNCWMCGRRKIERDYPELAQDWGHMDIELVKLISQQLPNNIVVQLHNNGEPLLYPQLGYALHLFKGKIRNFDTNGKLLLERASVLIENMETLTISVIENDPDGDEQYEIVKKFLNVKRNRRPNMVYRLLGDVKDPERWHNLPGIVTTRILHHPMGSFQYTKDPTKPEIGICLDLLHHMAIDRYGNVSICVRFDPEGHGRLGNLTENTLLELWNSPKRRAIIQKHIDGNRKGANPLCAKCQFWGVPTGMPPKSLI